ncbi:GcrA cell cycle regulator [Rhizobium ruizarguesonis]
MNIHAKITVGKQLVWDDEMKQRVAKLWNDGESSARIGALFGVTRNTIIGIATRNPQLFISKKKGAPKYLRTGGKKPRPRDPDEPRRKAAHNNVGHKLRDMHNTRKARMEAVQREAEEFAAGTSKYLKIAPSDEERLNSGMGKEFVDLGVHECRFGLNNGGPFIFCAEATDGAVYCEHHAQRAYRSREAWER